MNRDLYLLLADLILLIHFAFVAFVVLGLMVIWLGHFRHWTFVRNFYFRLAHLLAMGFVTAESVTGVICPLTTWEDQLRTLAGGGERYQGSFIQHWVHRLIFFEIDPKIFTVIYAVFLVAILASFWVVKPQWPWRTRNTEY